MLRFRTPVSLCFKSPAGYMLTRKQVFKPSEFSIINIDNHSEFDIENRLTLRDQQGRKLELKLNYMWVPYVCWFEI